MTLNEMKNNQDKYFLYLKYEEMKKSSIRKYVSAVENFIKFAEKSNYCKEICKECLIEYKKYMEKNYKPSTTNLYIVSINKYLKYLGCDDLHLKSLTIQAQNNLENCLTEEEYWMLLETAKKQKNNMVYYIIKTLANTGIRIAGLNYITIDSVKKGWFYSDNKGKSRNIVVSERICNELMDYCKEKNITSGYVFKGQKPNQSISQTTIRRWIKETALKANIDEDKAFPHNFRHLFAKTYLEKYGNLSDLADILGHEKIETTRIYTRTSINEKRKRLNDIGL